MEKNLSKLYSEFGKREGLCYYPTDLQAKAVKEIYCCIEKGFRKSLFDGNITSNDINVVKSNIKERTKSEDSEFISKFLETQMLVTFLKDNENT